MYKNRLLTLLILALSLSALTSCDKDDEKDIEPTRTDLLSTGTWTGVAVFANGQDVTQLFKDELQYDITKNTLKFEKAGTYVDTYERTTVSGSWEFANNEQAILFDKGDPDNEYTANISKLDGQQLHLKQDVKIEDETVAFEIRYKQ
jgi:hypothetical protein